MPMFAHQYSTYNGYIIEVVSEHSNNELSSSGSANFEFQFRVHRFIEFIVKPVSGEPFKVDERYNGAIDKTLAIELSTSHNHQQILFSEQKIIVILRKVGLSRYSRYLSKQISYAANKVWMNKRCENMGLKVEVWDRITYVHDEQETMERVMLETREEYVLVPLSEEAMEKLERIEFRLDNDYGCSDCMICFEEMEIGLEVIQMPCKHVFHGDCINLWLQRNHVCPLCRFKIEF